MPGRTFPFKHEEVYLNQDDRRADATADIGRFIADVANAKRLHSGLGCLPPADLEAAHAASGRVGTLVQCPVKGAVHSRDGCFSAVI